MADTSSQIDEIQLEPLQEENDLADRANPLVAKAVAFLNHPSVRAHKTEDKKTFLKKKGLAENEIDAALRLADSSESIADSFVNEFGSSAPLVPPEWGGSLHVKNQLQQYQNVGTFCLVFGGLAYAGYKIFKEFIEPYMFPERRRTFDLTMASFLEKTNQSMQQLHTTLERIQLSLESQQHSPVQSSVRELKAELASVKSLLLNRAQFPPAPLASGIAPSIPSWQLKSSGTGGGPAGDAGRYGSYSGREEGGRKTTRTGASGSSRRNVSGSDNTGNSSEESLEIIPSAGNRTHAAADYAASSPSPPAEYSIEEKVTGGPGGDGDL